MQVFESMARDDIAHLRLDWKMGQLIDRIGTLSLHPRRASPFESLVNSILHQQISGMAAGAIRNRFCQRFGDGTFPFAEDVARARLETLRKVGFSRPKATYVLDIARRAARGQLPALGTFDRMEDEEIVSVLSEIKGIGRWTVEMFLIFNLGRPDVLPTNDLGVQKGFCLAYGKRKLPQPDQLAQFGKRWAPYRSLASLYLWRATDLRAGGKW
jgi:DNA-3-methyladenine glycosylase II